MEPQLYVWGCLGCSLLLFPCAGLWDRVVLGLGYLGFWFLFFQFRVEVMGFVDLGVRLFGFRV